MRRITTRQAVLSDLAELAKLFNQYREFQGEKSDLAAATQFLQARFDHGESVVFIAQDGNATVGFAQLYPGYSSVSLKRVFWLNDLFVHESGRRKGVASKLLAAVETYAWALDASRVTLNVAKDNAAGQALYAERGWCPDSKFFMYHRFSETRD